MFRFLHKNIDQEELQELEKIKTQLGNLNYHLYEAYKIFEAYVKEKKGGQSTDSRVYNAPLKGHLIEAERLLKEMKVNTHKAVVEDEQRRVEVERSRREENEFLEDMQGKYGFKITGRDGKANYFYVSDQDGFALGGFHMPNVMGFSNSDFKTIFEKEVVAFL